MIKLKKFNGTNPISYAVKKDLFSKLYWTFDISYAPGYTVKAEDIDTENIEDFIYDYMDENDYIDKSGFIYEYKINELKDSIATLFNKINARKMYNLNGKDWFILYHCDYHEYNFMEELPEKTQEKAYDILLKNYGKINKTLDNNPGDFTYDSNLDDMIDFFECQELYEILRELNLKYIKDKFTDNKFHKDTMSVIFDKDELPFI